MPRCSVAVTGAPLSARTTDLVLAVQGAGYEVDLIATPASAEWVDLAAVTAATGAELRNARRSESSVRLPLPDCLVICPATFNTINKTAAGIGDTHAHSFFCECIAARLPTVVVPMINDRLWRHPALADSIARLKFAGSHFIDVHTGRTELRPVTSGHGREVVTAFDPNWIVASLRAAG
ncbi:MAG: hypothetical protein JWN95_3765 [Frankiales bacterium]|nr:hypothetical protein [Frankiales bacterium]